MVKFSKQLQSQLVPEWKSAFCNYSQLKKEVKQIKLSQSRHQSTTHNISLNPRSSDSTATLNSSISSLINLNNLTVLHPRKNVQKDVIQVHLRRSVSGDEDYYETEVADSMVLEAEKAFFASLDEQLNKVNQFYKSKEEEYMQRGEEIKFQLQRLMTMRKVLTLHQGYENGINNILISESSGFSPHLVPLSGMQMDESATEDDVNMSGVSEGVWPYTNGIYRDQNDHGASPYVSPTHAIDFNIPRTPMSSVSAVIQMLWNDVVSQTKNDRSPWRQFSNLDKKKIVYAEKMLRRALVEYYRGLGLLRSFSSLNVVAFAKILKKYDKVTGRKASLAYMKVVDRAYFNASNKVVHTMDEVEKLFTEQFTKGNRKKAMTFLRPLQPKDTHIVTFFLGIFSGCSAAFLVAYVIFLHLHGLKMMHDKTTMGNLMLVGSYFPIFSILSLIVLHLYMYGWNLFIWREKRINVAFIFEFAPNTEIKYREMLLIASGLATLVLGGLLGQVMAYTSLITSFNAEIVPVILLLVFLGLLIFPANICYQSARLSFLSSMKRIISAPLYKVIMADFFLADQLTSQVYLFRHVEYIMCYYIAGHFRLSGDVCNASNINFKVFAYLASLLPYWWRLMQCIRRWADEHDKMHLANGGKYLAAMVASVAALTYHNYKSDGWMAMSIISSTLATAYQLYWDFVVDWGLLRKDSKNFLLRDQLMLENKSVYFLSMVLNFVLRLAWLHSFTHFGAIDPDQPTIDFFFACLEVVRRGHWNFYRLENEHLNNVGKFRAVKMVPLPFKTVENEA